MEIRSKTPKSGSEPTRAMNINPAPCHIRHVKPQIMPKRRLSLSYKGRRRLWNLICSVLCLRKVLTSLPGAPNAALETVNSANLVLTRCKLHVLNRKQQYLMMLFSLLDPSFETPLVRKTHRIST